MTSQDPVIPSVVKAVLFATLALIAVPSPAAGQCGDGAVGTPSSITYSGTCAGNNPFQMILTTRTVQVTATLTCQDDSWKIQHLGPSTIEAYTAVDCEGAPEGGTPICEPEFAHPFYVGVVEGKHRFLYPTMGSSADPEDGSGCIPDGTYIYFLNESLPAAGCCAEFCQDEVACEAIEGKVYNEETCSCETPPPVCQDEENCVDVPPCSVDHWFDEDCGCCKPLGSPIILDLKDNGLKFVDPADGVLFDIFANQRPVRVSWPSSEQAYWLALDRNVNGRIDSGAELFGNATRLADGRKALHGYLALAEFDVNDDKKIDASDPVYGRLQLWRRPLQRNGVQPPDDWIPVAGSVVESIGLEAQEVGKRDQWGNKFQYRAKAQLSSGEIRWSYDVFLVTVRTGPTTPPHTKGQAQR